MSNFQPFDTGLIEQGIGASQLFGVALAFQLLGFLAAQFWLRMENGSHGFVQAHALFLRPSIQDRAVGGDGFEELQGVCKWLLLFGHGRAVSR